MVLVRVVHKQRCFRACCTQQGSVQNSETEHGSIVPSRAAEFLLLSPIVTLTRKQEKDLILNTFAKHLEIIISASCLGKGIQPSCWWEIMSQQSLGIRVLFFFMYPWEDIWDDKVWNAYSIIYYRSGYYKVHFYDYIANWLRIMKVQIQSTRSQHHMSVTHELVASFYLLSELGNFIVWWLI